MRYSRRPGSLAAIPLLCAAVTFPLAPETRDRAPQSRGLERRVEAYLRPYVRMDHFAGTVLLARGDSILVHRAFGLADRELGVPVRTRSRFRIGSITKDFTAALILALRDDGALSLDDPLARFVADFPGCDRILIRHLLNHTHGVPSWRGLPNAEAMGATGVTLPEAVRILADQPLEFEPGVERRYGSSGYLLLAHVIEVLTGHSYSDVLRDRLLEPLDLHDTGSLEGLEIVPDLADSYVPTGSPPWLEHPPPTHPSITVGSASAFSTTHDLFVWSRSVPAQRLGWGESEAHGRRMLWTSGLTDGYMARIHRFPDDDVTLVLLSNIFTPAFRPILRDLAALVFGERVAPPEAWRPVRLSRPARHAVSGDWICNGPWERFTIELDGDELVFEIEGNRFPLIPRSATTLHLPTDYGTLSFSERGPDGFRRAQYDGGFEAQCGRAD